MVVARARQEERDGDEACDRRGEKDGVGGGSR
jgi:hypothetical protein